jgi:hypothetical protein
VDAVDKVDAVGSRRGGWEEAEFFTTKTRRARRGEEEGGMGKGGKQKTAFF